jgi:hypothetical protein
VSLTRYHAAHESDIDFRKTVVASVGLRLVPVVYGDGCRGSNGSAA